MVLVPSCPRQETDRAPVPGYRLYGSGKGPLPSRDRNDFGSVNSLVFFHSNHNQTENSEMDFRLGKLVLDAGSRSGISNRLSLPLPRLHGHCIDPIMPDAARTNEDKNAGLRVILS